MRPAGRLPRVERLHGVDVYAPWCANCANDKDTQWEYLPGVDSYGGGAEAICSRCNGIFHPSAQEARRAREPERLAARLAELRAERRAS